MAKKEEEINFEMKMASSIRLDDGLPSPYQHRPRSHIMDYNDWDIADDDCQPMEKKPFFKKLKDNIVLAYYDFLLIFWRIKQNKKRR